MKCNGTILSFPIAVIAVVAVTIGCKNQAEIKILLSTLSTFALVLVVILCFQRGRPRIPHSSLTTSESSSSDSVSVSDSESVATKRVYDVFLSFCGKDTREGFTDFLYTYLDGADIVTFRDKEELRVGKNIRPELLTAINESNIYIPIFSLSYASSIWCLLELAEIVECYERGTHEIIPVFYDVTPSNVKHQTGSYKKAFEKHEKEFDKETVKRWREALSKVAEIKGHELKKETNGYQGELGKIIVEEVLEKLKKNYTTVPENLVEIDDYVENLKGLLKIDSGGVQMVGIHGIHGLGKTTIAKVTYNQICGRFESHCFLNNVRENSKHSDGILSLQSQLISKIQHRKVSISDVDEGMRRLECIFRGRKVLVVLDDIDEISQATMLIGKRNWFGAGSRIIITTTDTKVLTAIGDSYDSYTSYEPPYMPNILALKLFSKHAFMRDSPPKEYEYLSKEVVSIAAGLPLVLRVLGASLFGIQVEDIWLEELKKLSKEPHAKVLEKLKFGYETLERDQKQIFLDIACFFTGCNITVPCYMWRACGFSVRKDISVLIRRSLISVGDDDIFVMHDQIRMLGWEIVRAENRTEFGNRSRLWYEREAMEVLETDQGTRRVVGLCLPFGLSKGPVLASYFRNLQSLRYISMESYDLDGDFENLLPNLKWLKWTYSGKFTPSSLPMTKLVILELSSSQLTPNSEIWSQLKKAKQLKLLDLSKCDGLSIIPHLSTYDSLEILNVKKIKSLCRLDGVEQLKSLKYLYASRCKCLKTLPSLSNLTNLAELYLDYCEELVEIPGLEKLEVLKVLDIHACKALKKLPNLSNMNELREFRAGGCWSLIKIEGLEKLESLQILDISNCRSLERVKVSVWKDCKTLLSKGCTILIEIVGLEKLKSLENLDLRDCESLERLPDVSNLEELKTVKLNGCSKLLMVPGLEKLESLEHLDLGDCRSLQIFLDVSKLQRLKTFVFKGCSKAIKIEDMGKLKSLEQLEIGDCESLEQFLEFSNIKRLETFTVQGCMDLIEIDRLKKLEYLQDLCISDCISLKYIIFSNMDSLKNLTICKCEKLSHIEGLERLRSLKRFNVADCPSLERIPDLPNVRVLRDLEVKYCNALHELELLGVISLENLSIFCCDKLTEIRGFQSLKNLKLLSIRSLKELANISGLEELKSLESLTINQCINSIEELPDLSNLENLIEKDVSYCLKIPEISAVEDLNLKNLLVFPKTEQDPTYYGIMLLDGEHGETSNSMIELKNNKPQAWLSDEMDWEQGETSSLITQKEQCVSETWKFYPGIALKSEVLNPSIRKHPPRHGHPRRQHRAKR